jgi:NADH-quinone oxidoreductase subunit G
MEGKEPGWNAFNVLHTAASRVAGLDLGFVPADKNALDAQGLVAAVAKDKLDVLYLLGADEFELPETGSAFIVYQGSHGDRSAHRADVILPGAAYTEKSATYVNIEGRAQMTERAVFPPGEAKEDWAIIRALSAEVAHTLPYDTLGALRAAMYAAAPELARIGAREAATLDGVQALSKKGSPLTQEPFAAPIRDFYLTNPIARASAVMAEMSALKKSMNAAGRLKAAE